MRAARAAAIAIALTVTQVTTAQGPVVYTPGPISPPAIAQENPILEAIRAERGEEEAVIIFSAVIESAKKHGLPPELLGGLLWTESRFDPGAVSKAGAIGIAQLMPETAQEVGVNPWSIQEGVDGGAAYLAKMVRWKDGDLRAALAAYNAGPNVREWPAETRVYVEKVMAAAERMKGERDGRKAHGRG